MCNGTVKWFNEQKGQKVTFEIEEDPHNNGKSRAANVCVVE